jgi:hypothetical protein
MIETGKRYRGMAAEHAAAKAEGRAPLGVFRTPEGVFSAHWEREYPGCFIAGQGATMWVYEPASATLAERAGV